MFPHRGDGGVVMPHRSVHDVTRPGRPTTVVIVPLFSQPDTDGSTALAATGSPVVLR